MRLHSTRLVLIMATLALAACDRSTPPTEQTVTPAKPAVEISPAMKEAAQSITGDYMREQIAKLSSDAFEGRGTASKGDELAMQWLETQLQALGYQPGGDNGSYRQTFDVIGMTGKMPKTWTFTHGNKKRALKYYDEYIGSSGVQEPKAEIKNAELVFVGYGIQAPE